MQWLFLVAAVVGTLLPLSYFVRFLATHGLDVSLFFAHLFHNDISSFFAVDVLVSGLVLLLFIPSEGRRLRMKKLWVYVMCTLLAGVSSGLPLFLFFRERRLNQERGA